MTTEQQIAECEKKLLEAFKTNDLETLDDLLHDDLLFNIVTGKTITKAMDLEAYRTGNVTIHSVLSSEQLIHVIGENAVVTLTLNIKGEYYQRPMDGKFRYIRVWKLVDGKWKVIGGSSIQV